MFNLLISYDSKTWEGPGRLVSPLDRFKEFSGDEAACIDASKPESLKSVESILTILMYEKGASGENAHRARIGFVSDVLREQITSKSSDVRRTWNTECLTFTFELLGELHQFDVLSMSEELQFGRWEESRTHWAIKDGRIPIDLVKKAAGATEAPTIEDEVRSMLALPAETNEVEFKETLHWCVRQDKFHDDRLTDVQKAICALLNRGGGTILIGVQDTANKPVGIARDLTKYKTQDGFQRKIAEAFGSKLKPDPSDLVRVRFLEINGVTLARVDVRGDHSHHYSLQDKVYVRRDGESKELTGPNLAAWATRRSRAEE